MPRAKKTKQTKPLTYDIDRLKPIQDEYIDTLGSDVKYSLEVDPTEKYGLTPLQKDFVRYYIDFRNVNTAAELCGIDQDAAKEWFKMYAIQTEIRRINLALHQRQFATKLLNLDALGGYLTSMLTDEYVPLAEQLSPTDKLRVVDTLIKLNQLKAEAMDSPDVIIEKDIKTELKELSVDAIKSLIDSSENKQKKVELINELNADDILSIEEKSYLETLSTKELLALINETTKNKGDN